MFADEEGVFVQRGRAAVGEVVSQLGAGADDGELALPTIGEFVGLTSSLYGFGGGENGWIPGELRMVWEAAPID